jgi:hypothetical protein
VGNVLIERGVDYGPGKLADVYRPRQAGPAPLAGRTASLDFARGLARERPGELATGAGGALVLAEPDTDHAGVVMTDWDAARRRCRPTTEAHAVTAGRLSARTIGHAAPTIGHAGRMIGHAARMVPGAGR